jgi:hypothetical protein
MTGFSEQGAPSLKMRCVPRQRRGRKAEAAEPPPELVDRLEGLLPREALEGALEGLEPEEITGPGGLLTQLAGRVIETALGAELTEHLGHPPGGVPAAGNVRNGSPAKTVHTDLGPVAIKTPHDRDGTFEPQLVGKRRGGWSAWTTRSWRSTPAG